MQLFAHFKSNHLTSQHSTRARSDGYDISVHILRMKTIVLACLRKLRQIAAIASHRVLPLFALGCSLFATATLDANASGLLYDYQNHLSLRELFENPPWTEFYEMIDRRDGEPSAEVAIDRMQLPLRMMLGSVIEASGGRHLHCSYPLFTGTTQPNVSLSPSCAGRGWSFEPFAGPFCKVDPAFLNQAMRLADFCRDNEDPYAALSIYKSALPLLGQKILGIQYVSPLFARTGKFKQVEPFLLRELAFVKSFKKPKETSRNYSPEDWQELVKSQRTHCAMLQILYLSHLMQGYILDGDMNKAHNAERQAMLLDASTAADRSDFHMIIDRYVELGKLGDAERIFDEAYALRKQRYGVNSESAVDAEFFNPRERTELEDVPSDKKK